ncbi:rhomboid family intramembrane serine protease [Bartonella harrusi]|uniref:Rhomboid family intramembrane serine protease n=1 Tax=Bartonella harrusi TaxID=2961895 RepID=A0ABY5ETR0_9HYPH|nr:rhomboid family intramembrane serine protease [Bartonella harrusi]UTO28804.1 rhomboid family intramembrane serine protease [Bartonella harrusi]
MKDIDHQYKNVLFLPNQPREPLLNVPLIIVALIALCFGIYFVQEYFFSEKLYIKSLEFFSFTPSLFKADPLTFCYTIISYSFMHGSLKHITINMVWLLVFGSPLVKLFGNLRFLIFLGLTATFSVLTYFVAHPDSVISLVGASGAISGMMGAFARYGFPQGYWGGSLQSERFLGPLLSIKQALCSRDVLVYITIWLSVDFIIGISSFLFEEEGISIAWEAHVGGFVSGFLLIGFFGLSRKK